MAGHVFSDVCCVSIIYIIGSEPDMVASFL